MHQPVHCSVENVKNTELIYDLPATPLLLTVNFTLSSVEETTVPVLKEGDLLFILPC